PRPQPVRHPQDPVALDVSWPFLSRRQCNRGAWATDHRTVNNPRSRPTPAVSLGGVESMVRHPATMTHARISADIHIARGIDDGLGLQQVVGVLVADGPAGGPARCAGVRADTIDN